MSSKVEGASWLEEGADDDFDESFFGDFVKDCKDGDLRPCAPKKPLSNEEELAIFVERAFTFVHLTGCVLMYCSMMVNFAGARRSQYCKPATGTEHCNIHDLNLDLSCLFVLQLPVEIHS